MNLFDQVREIVSDRLRVKAEKISLESSLPSDLGVDSFDSIELVTAFEGKFNIEIPDSDVDTLVTIGDVIKYIENKIKVKEGQKEAIK